MEELSNAVESTLETADKQEARQFTPKQRQAIATARKAVKQAGGVVELANAIGISRITVWRWYVGKAVPSPLALRLINKNI